MNRTPERVAAVVAALEEDPGQLTAELAERVGLETRHLAPLLWRMQEQGLVVPEGRRWFAAPSDR